MEMRTGHKAENSTWQIKLKTGAAETCNFLGGTLDFVKLKQQTHKPVYLKYSSQTGPQIRL